jgi:hypothetical protein
LEARRLLSSSPLVVAADDPADPSVEVQDQLVAEGTPQVVFDITVPAGDVLVTLDYATAPGTAAADLDFTTVAGSLLFAPDTAAPRTQSVAVSIADDALWEDSEWFYLELSNVNGGGLPGGGATYRATATIRDNDQRPTLRVSDARVDEGDAGDTPATFVVSLSAALDRPVTVDYATANGTASAPSDYAAATGTLTFEPGETTKSVAVAVHGDNADESNETFTLNLRSASPAAIADAQGVATIVEDDDHPPTVNIVDVSPDPRTPPVDSAVIVFSEPVSGVDLPDLTLTRDGGPNLLTADQTLTGAADGVTWTLGNLGPLTGPAGRYTLTLAASGSGIADRSGNALIAGATDAWRTFATVADRRVFYNNSFYDGNDPAPGSADDAAVAPDKRALRAGESASFANVTGYSSGINGIFIDTNGLPIGTGPGPGDFAFKAGNGGDPASWPAAPTPVSVTVRRGAGAGGSDRITVVFPDGAVRNTWLGVTILVDDRTGLSAPDVFYFGNLVGDAGDPPISGRGGTAAARPIAVGPEDLYTARRAAASASAGPAVLTNAADHNRDGRVNVLDLALARANVFRALQPPATPPALTTATPIASAALRLEEWTDLLGVGSAARPRDDR